MTDPIDVDDFPIDEIEMWLLYEADDDAMLAWVDNHALPSDLAAKWQDGRNEDYTLGMLLNDLPSMDKILLYEHLNPTN
jgi:hypothetical protein